MKKGIQILLVLVMVISILGMSVVGCAKEEAPAAPAVPAKPAPVAPTPTPAKPAPTTPAPAKPAPAPAAEVYKLRLQSIGTSAQRVHQILVDDFAAKVNEATDGRIDISVYPSGAIISGPDCLDAISKNVIEMSMNCGSYFSGILPEADIEGGVPMAWSSHQDFEVIWYELGWEDIMREAYATKNTYLIAEVMSSGITFWGKTQIQSLEDFKGLKIRHFGRHLDLLNKLGASAVFIPHEDVYTALQTGTIDASGTAAKTFEDQKLYEVCKYFVKAPYLIFPSTNNYLINLDVWNGLPNDLQVIMDLAARWASSVMGRKDVYETDQMFERMKAQGVTFYTLPDDVVKVMVDTAMPLFDDCASKSDRSAQMISVWKDYMRSKGLLE